MPDTPLTQLSAQGQSVWIDFLSRKFVQDGDLAGLVRDGVKASPPTPRSSSPRSPRATRTTSSCARCSRPRPSPRRSSSRSPSRTSRPPATSCGRSGTRPARTPATAGSRSRSTRTSRTTPRARSRRPSACTRSSTAQPVHQDPGDEGRAARDRGDDRRRHPGQRHADLLAPAPPRGRRGLHPRAAALRRRRRRPHEIASVASFFVSRVDTEADKRLDAVGGHDELKGTLAIANAKLAYQTYQEVFAGEQLGGAGGQGRARRSAACGRRRRPRTPPTAT